MALMQMRSLFNPNDILNVIMKKRMSIEDVRHLVKDTPAEKLNPHLFESVAVKKKKKSKYNNNKIEVDGEVFDSEKEANRYQDLKKLLKVGEIGLLERQAEYQLNEGGVFSYLYIADFVYVEAKTGKTVVEDCKGFRTAEYLKKKRLMKKIYGIEILET